MTKEGGDSIEADIGGKGKFDNESNYRKEITHEEVFENIMCVSIDYMHDGRECISGKIYVYF